MYVAEEKFKKPIPNVNDFKSASRKSFCPLCPIVVLISKFWALLYTYQTFGPTTPRSSALERLT